MDDSKPVRVAHIVGKMIGGGVESFLMNYYRNIDKEKIQFDFIIDADSTVVPREEIEKLGGRIIEIPPYQKIYSYIKELKKVLEENNYKIVHSHLNALSVFPLYCAYSVKIPIRIAHSHSTTNKKEWKKNIIKNLLRPFSKLFATEYFACSEHAAKWLFGKKSVINKNVIIIHNAIDVEKFKYNDENRNKIRKEYGLENKFVIGHVGRFTMQKNHEFLIDVFSEVFKENKESVLLLIGDGPLEDKIRKKVNELGIEKNVLFLGVKENVNEFMQAMDCFVFPSLYEGLGIVLIEAQAASLKCIASTEVPIEVKILNNVEFLDLKNDDIIMWKNSILRVMEREKNNNTEIIRNAGYDINIENKKLLKEYIRIFKEI